MTRRRFDVKEPPGAAGKELLAACRALPIGVQYSVLRELGSLEAVGPMADDYLRARLNGRFELLWRAVPETGMHIGLIQDLDADELVLIALVGGARPSAAELAQEACRIMELGRKQVSEW